MTIERKHTYWFDHHKADVVPVDGMTVYDERSDFHAFTAHDALIMFQVNYPDQTIIKMGCYDF